jgi:hypothetical protein
MTDEQRRAFEWLALAAELPPGAALALRLS